MAKEPINHHYIPQFILRGFVDPKLNKLHLSNGGTMGRGETPKHPRNAFSLEHLNSTIDQYGHHDTELETDLSKIDSSTAPISAKIIAAACKGELPKLEGAELAAWNNFIDYQLRRPPDVQERIGADINFDARYDNVIDEVANSFEPNLSTNRVMMKTNEYRSRMKTNVGVDARRPHSNKVVNVLNNRGIKIVRIVRKNVSFIISDYPLLRCGASMKLDNPDCELWLPISSTIAISPGGEKGSEAVYTLDQDVVRKFNIAISKQSKLIAGCSDNLIKSLSKYVSVSS